MVRRRGPPAPAPPPAPAGLALGAARRARIRSFAGTMAIAGQAGASYSPMPAFRLARRTPIWRRGGPRTMAPVAGYDFGAGRAGRIARHAGDAARAVARGAAGDRSAGDVADGVANAVAAAAKVVADIADDSAKAVRALSNEDGDGGVLARTASDADEARAAAAAAAAIADEVDPNTALARRIAPTESEVLANLEKGPISTAAPHLAPTVANAAREAASASRLVYESMHHARSFAARMELDCRAAIELYG